jgi:adenylate cyclase
VVVRRAIAKFLCGHEGERCAWLCHSFPFTVYEAELRLSLVERAVQSIVSSPGAQRWRARMAQQEFERRLTAILALDAVAYSRLMEANEELTHTAFKAHLNDLINPLVAAHHGRVVKSTGDGALVEFQSVVKAVQCGAEIQRNMAVRNADVPENRRIRFRIGINVSDVISDKDDIYGDGVNKTVRLEGLARPGGIYLSQAAYDQVSGKVDLGFEFVGNRRLKNIASPILVYRVNLDGRVGTTRARPLEIGMHLRERWPIWGSAAGMLLVTAFGAAVWFEPSLLPLHRSSGPEKKCELPANPSIAVLPFKNLSNDPQHKHLVDGTTNDVITDLARFSNLFVIAANSTFRYKDKAVKPQEVGEELCVRYVLEGTFQSSHGHVRINAQLVDTTTGYHVWADRYDREYTHIFDIQSDITDRIVQIIGPISDAQGKLLEVELDRIARTPTENLQAYDHFLRAVTYYKKFSKDANLAARRELERAIVLDPSYAKAIAKVSWTYLQEYWNGWADSLTKSLDRAEQSALRAVSVDPAEADAHEALGAVRLFLRQHDLAIDSLRRAVELNPNGADLLMYLGWAMTYGDQLDEAVQWMDKAIARNPHYPGYYLWDIAWGYFVDHRYEDAAKTLERRENKTSFTYLLLAVNYKKLGREKEAMDSMKIFRELEPDYSVEVAAATEPFKKESDLTHFLDALRDVGLPENTAKGKT